MLELPQFWDVAWLYLRLDIFFTDLRKCIHFMHILLCVIYSTLRKMWKWISWLLTLFTINFSLLRNLPHTLFYQCKKALFLVNTAILGYNSFKSHFLAFLTSFSLFLNMHFSPFVKILQFDYYMSFFCLNKAKIDFSCIFTLYSSIFENMKIWNMTKTPNIWKCQGYRQNGNTVIYQKECFFKVNHPKSAPHFSLLHFY